MRKKETGKRDEEFFRWVTELSARGVGVGRIAMETGASPFTVLRWRQRPQERVNPQYRRIVGEMHQRGSYEQHRGE